MSTMTTSVVAPAIDLDTLSNADWQLAFADLPQVIERTVYGGACHCQDRYDHTACINETPLIFVQAQQSCDQ